MSIRFKVIALIVISTGFLLVTYSFFSKTFLISGFKEVERKEAFSDIEVLIETFDSLMIALDNKSADWSAWDDAYTYVQKKNKSFEKANFLPETMKVLDLSYLAYFDSKGNSIGHRAFDKQKGAFVSFPRGLERVLRPGSRIFEFTSAEASHRGLLNTPDGVVMFAVRPVYNSKLRGPPKGFILMGRLMTDEMASKISGITGRPVSFEKPAKATAAFGIDLQQRIVQKEISNETILGLAVLNDFYHIPVAVIKTEIPRTILQIGAASYRKTLTFFVSVLVILVSGVIVLLDRMFFKRLSDLDEQVNLLDKNEVSKLEVDGADEVARLAKSLNNMLGALHSRNMELLQANEIINNQNQALVSAAKMSALGEMAGGVAHEINTPLTVIKLRSEMILSEVEVNACDHGRKIQNSLEIIDKTVDRITKIIQSLRAFSREASAQEKIEYSVSDIVSEALNLCNEKFKTRGIDLRVECSEDHVVLCRPTEITQVLINLLNNAYDAIENSEEKIISVRTEKLDNGFIGISVSDSGPGVAEEIQDKIMQPFFTTKEFGKGTGIGLSISKGIAESHGGKLYLDVNSKQTRMVLTFPITNKDVTENADAA